MAHITPIRTEADHKAALVRIDALMDAREDELLRSEAEPVEVSLGLSEWQRGQDWPAVYQSADLDLYEDKKRRKLARDSDRIAERMPIRLFPRARRVRRRVAGS